MMNSKRLAFWALLTAGLSTTCVRAEIRAADCGEASLFSESNVTAKNAGVQKVDGTTRLIRTPVGSEWAEVHLPISPAPQDWSAWSGFGLPVQNLSDTELELTIQLFSATSGGKSAVQAHAVFAPGESAIAFLPLNAPSPKVFGMLGEPPIPPQINCRFRLTSQLSGKIDLEKVNTIVIRVQQKTKSSLVFNVGQPIREQWDLGRKDYHDLVDPFGQPTRASGLPFIRNAAELKIPSGSNTASNLPHTVEDQFCGWIAGREMAPKSDAFRIGKDTNGRWRLITPDGNAFFSIGVDELTINSGLTYVEGRESMFQWLPGPDDPLSRWYGTGNSSADDYYRRGRLYDHGRFFNFFGANVQRTFGNEWKKPWEDRLARRLHAWGFNTVGAWSSQEVSSDLRFPYTVALALPGGSPVIASRESDIGAIPDVFDPAFRSSAKEYIKREVAKYRDDPYIIGYFIDNEIPWGRAEGKNPKRMYSAVVSALSSQGGSAKSVMIDWLKQKYKSSDEFATAWKLGSSVSWDTLKQQPLRIDGSPSDSTVRDLSALTSLMAQSYYQTIRDILRESDNRHLYLGSRINEWIPEVIDACSKFCDVVSINLYRREPLVNLSQYLMRVDRPFLISEFHFGSSDNGFSNPGLVDVGTENERGEAYQSFVNEVTSSPYIVGFHWFQYADQPVTGRLRDGENAHVGLVSVADVPYPAFVGSVSNVNKDVIRRLRPY